MINNSMTSALCVLGTVALSACGDPAAFEEAPLEAPDEVEEESPKETPEETSPDRVATAFDIAEDLTRFVLEEEAAEQEGPSDHGGSFVTQGYIYPFGFLKGREGTDEDGAPAHPAHVIGEWTCWGTFLGAAGDGRASAVSTHIYDFYQEPGYAEHKSPSRHTVVSEGHELTEEHAPLPRSITGATGLAEDAEGELVQMLDGTNKTGGVNLRIFIANGFEPLFGSEAFPPLPPRETDPCDWDLFSGERCPLF